MLRILLALLVMVVLASRAIADDPTAYLCLPDNAVGLVFNEQHSRWYPQTFTTDRKYILRPAEPDGRDKDIAALLSQYDKGNGQEWVFVDVRDGPTTGGSLEAMCRKDPRLSFVDLQFSCTRWLSNVAFNENTSKFERYYAGSYLNMPPIGKSPDTPVIEIGHCEPYIEEDAK